MTLSVDKHCEMLSNTIRDKSKAMYDGFSLFVQMFSALIGGSVLLRVQYEGKTIPKGFAELSNLLAVTIAIMSAIIIYEHYRTWIGYRTRLHQVAGVEVAAKGELTPIVPEPTKRSELTVGAMIAVIAVSSLLFFAFNPLDPIHLKWIESFS